MKSIRNIINALKQSAGDESLTVWLELKDKINAAQSELTEARRALDIALSDENAPTQAGVEAKQRESIAEARLERMQAKEALVRAGIFGAANTAWTEFLNLKRTCEDIARDMAARHLLEAGIDETTDPEVFAKFTRASKFLRAEAGFQLNLTSPGVDLEQFLESTLPAMAELRPALEARLSWWERLQSGKQKWADGPPAVTGAGVLQHANKPEIIEEPEEEPTGPNDAALLASGVPESHLAAQRKKQRRAAQAAGEAPPDWQPQNPRETAPIHA